MYFSEDRMYLNLVKTVGSVLRDMSIICTTHGLDTWQPKVKLLSSASHEVAKLQLVMTGKQREIMYY